MSIRKYITKKNVIIGAVAGTAIIGGIVALVVKHAKKKKAVLFVQTVQLPLVIVVSLIHFVIMRVELFL